MIPLGWCFTTRQRDEDAHWWDADPDVLHRNLAFEATLDTVIGGPGGGPPRRGRTASPVHALIQYTLRAGLVAGIAAGLVWFLAAMINSKLDAQSAKADAIQTMLLSHTVTSAGLSERLAHTDAVLERLAALMFVQCVNQAKTSSDRSDCARAAGK